MSKAKSSTKAKPAAKEAPAAIASTTTMPAGFKAKRVITLPSLAIKNAGEAHTLKILDEMRISNVAGKVNKETGLPEKPATVCTAVDIGTGQQVIFIVSAVVKGNLERDYPDGAYVGLLFYIKNMGKRKEGQRYNDFEIVEVEAE